MAPFNLQGVWRKMIYISLYELIAIVIASTGLAAGAGAGASLERAGAIAVVSSVIAVVWNLVYNTLFERWEARQVDVAQQSDDGIAQFFVQRPHIPWIQRPALVCIPLAQ